jgi:heterotetrameric sarcosine oxidase delta subunit
MLRIACPHCGERDEVEFRYRGDASVRRPPADADATAYAAYVYERRNPRGWHLEWWFHGAGCRQWLQLWRHTVTHEIHSVGTAGDPLPPPRDASSP